MCLLLNQKILLCYFLIVIDNIYYFTLDDAVGDAVNDVASYGDGAEWELEHMDAIIALLSDVR